MTAFHQIREVSEDIYWVGALNANLRVFDIIIDTEHGTTYNSYLIKGEKTALIDTVHDDFSIEFVEKLKAVTDPAKIDYVVVNHTEMDHSLALKRLLDIAPNIEVLSSKSAAHLLKNVLNRPFNSRIVAEGDKVSLGSGKTLRFIISPFWHWPDTMFTYLEEDKILFPCDGFASHFCDERLFDDRVDNFDKDMKYYFDHIMGPFKEKIREGCKKVRELELSMICPSHGPILRTDPWKYVARYEEWSKDIEKSGKEAAIFYVSAYGCTEAMAQSISDGMRNASGCAIHLVNVAETQLDKIMEIMERSDAVLLGSPTINKDALKPIWDTISCVALINGNGKGKKWGVFGSYGWSGEATKFLQERLKSMKLDVVEDRVTAVLVPNEEELGRCREFGERFAREVLS